ncbi:hypothetical protein GCM10010387_16490 [Streptomyces inusitatus]|uniref:Uncharacterized protein n=1 Tax=Streptomyces inusitatus TaxID=68221 RepID=A0A918PW40_9ACTN|nr:hypothetical protein [Streptomyces inusitatus]GGZ23927.1 hypothetical protein GCM10010387_16490 [Streptomyces inusitatus]
MLRRTAITASGSLAAGIAIALVDGLPHPPAGTITPLAVDIAPLTCMTVITLCILHRWLDRYTANIRTEMAKAAEQRRACVEEISDRLAEVTRREAAVNRSAKIGEARTAALLNALAEARKENACLRTELEEIGEERNTLIATILQQSADRFRPRPEAATVTRPAPCIPMPARQRARDGAVPQPVHGTVDPALN